MCMFNKNNYVCIHLYVQRKDQDKDVKVFLFGFENKEVLCNPFGPSIWDKKWKLLPNAIKNDSNNNYDAFGGQYACI